MTCKKLIKIMRKNYEVNKWKEKNSGELQWTRNKSKQFKKKIEREKRLLCLLKMMKGRKNYKVKRWKE